MVYIDITYMIKWTKLSPSVFVYVLYSDQTLDSGKAWKRGYTTVDVEMAVRCSSSGLFSEMFDRKLIFASPLALQCLIIIFSLLLISIVTEST